MRGEKPRIPSRPSKPVWLEITKKPKLDTAVIALEGAMAMLSVYIEPSRLADPYTS